MALDVQTLFLLALYVEAILGLLLLLAWIQNTENSGLAWWGLSDLMRSFSVGLYGMYGSIPDLISIDFAGALLFTTFGLTWTGARVFNGRQPRPGSLFVGAILWMIAAQFADFREAPELRWFLSASIIAGFSWASAYEVWRGRDEGLVSIWPVIMLLFGHGALFLLRSPVGIKSADAADGVLSSAWLTVLSAESLLFSIAIAFVLLAIGKERAETNHRKAALTDPLTGLPNRRSFFRAAEDLRRAQVRRGRPIALLAMDLDRFKSINDEFGHATGDRVLRLFAQVAQSQLGSADLIGRLGGEEFVVLLADAVRHNAYEVAEQLRSRFASAAVLEEQALAATVSIGVAIMQQSTDTIDVLLREADKGLYRAKALGRNRVELAETNIVEQVDREQFSRIAA
jgi:diguanylate cyclase (GGDEF)-like protein